MKKSSIKLGDVVAIEFLDHTLTSGDEEPGPLPFVVYGRLVAVSRLTYSVASWVNPDGSTDHNTDSFQILRSTVTKARRLR